MANPSKPSTVKVDALKHVLEELQSIQRDVGEPPAGTFDEIGTTIEIDLQGMQGNAAHVAGERYSDSVKYVAQYAWPDVKNGITALVSMLQTTIAQHTAADSGVATGAQQTNTTMAAGKG